MSRVPASLVLLLVTTNCRAATPPIAWPEGLAEVCAGEVRINGVAARYAVVTPGKGADALDRILEVQGWKTSAAAPVRIPGDVNGMHLSTYERRGEWLWAAEPADHDTWAVLAVFGSRPDAVRADRDAPGREPMGLPRFGGGRRVLHLAGRGFEAACYRAQVTPGAILAEARMRLGAMGWTTSIVSTTGLAANRAGAPPVAVVAEPAGTGSTVLVLAGSLVR
jgi:hypothetical protein